MTQHSPPGWFPDPAGTPQLRYYDGQQWTENFSALPPPPKRSGNSGAKAVLAVVGAIVLIVILGNVLGGNEDNKSTSTSSRTSTSSSSSSFDDHGTSSAPRTSTTPTVSAAGSSVRDGQFEFRVLDISQTPKISDKSGYMSQTAQGVFYVVTLSVKNIGDEARSYSGTNQKLIDASNREYEADGAVDYYLNDDFLTDINPGNSIQARVAFDVPQGTVPAMLEVHDSMFSGGAKVRI